MPQVNFGRYTIKEQLGQGGMATVFKAYDPRFERDVAIKILPEQFLDEPDFRARFEREARVIAALEHPAIVPVYDYGEENGQPYLVMRYMAGGSLADRLSLSPISLSEAAKLYNRLAPALDKAHAAGIIHRDLKPGNILFDQDGYAYIADFGIAKLLDVSATTLTSSGLIGTPVYMSPEQARGDSDIDGRSDIYALGAMLFHLLSGKPPFEADTAVQLAVKHIIEPPPSLLAINPSLPAACEKIIQRAMAKNKVERFSTAQEFASSLSAASHNADQTLIVQTPQITQEGIESAEHDVTFISKQPVSPDARGRKVWLWAAALLAIGLLILVGIWQGTSRFSSASILLSNSPTSVLATIIPSETMFPTPTSTVTPTRSATATRIARATVTPQPVAEQSFYLTLNQNYHCRGGPGSIYPDLRDFTQGSRLLVFGRDETGEWYLVKIDDPATRKKLCWIIGGDFSGDPVNLPVCTWTGDGYTENQICH